MISGAIVAALAAGDATSIAWSEPEQFSAVTAPEATLDRAPDPTDPTGRVPDEQRVTRSEEERPALTPEGQLGATRRAAAIATEPRFLTEDLNVRPDPSEGTTVLTVLDAGSKVSVTGRTVDGYAQIVYDGKLRWVTAEYLSTDRPEDDDDSGSGGLSDAPCPSGSDVEDGLVSNAIAVHRAVCAEFPEVTSYGGLRPGDDGEHGTGQALDIMIPDSETGDAIAEFVRANYSALGVGEVIWAQHIWTVERSSEGWRWMEDRGSDTANHYDHVHVTVY